MQGVESLSACPATKRWRCGGAHNSTYMEVEGGIEYCNQCMSAHDKGGEQGAGIPRAQDVSGISRVSITVGSAEDPISYCILCTQDM